MAPVRSMIVHHFIMPEETEGNFKAICKHCNRRISCSMKALSNLHAHIKRIHPTAIPTTISVSMPQKSSGKLKKYNSTHHRQLKSTNLLANVIAENMLPLRFLESPSFKMFCESLDQNYSVPSRKTMSDGILNIHKLKMEENLMSLLGSATSVCVTLDLWTSGQMKSYIGMTGHFLLNWTLHSVMLACKRFRGLHTVEHIARTYEEILDHYKISNKVNTVVTDNVSDMVVAFAHFEDDPSVGEEEKSDEEDEEGLHPISSTDLDDVYFPQHERCFAHTLQLTVNDGLRSADNLGQAISKASDIVSHTQELFEGENGPPPPSVTKWISQLKMIRSILNADEAKLDALPVAKLSAAERYVLSDAVYILTPFEVATDCVQGSDFVTASYIIPCVRGLSNHLSHCSTAYNSSLVSSLKEAIDKRLAVYEQKKLYQIASVLDPRFKLTWCNSDEKATLTAEIKALAAKLAAATEDTPTSGSPAKKTPLDMLFGFLDPPDSSLAQLSPITKEIEQYLLSPHLPATADPLQFWRAQTSVYPTLSRVAAEHLQVPASSAAVECLFGIVGRPFRPDRCVMSDELFETLLFLKSNGLSTQPSCEHLEKLLHEDIAW